MISYRSNIESEAFTNYLSPEEIDLISPFISNLHSEKSYNYDVFPKLELEGFAKNWSSVINQNRYYANQLGWNQFYDQINDLLLPFSGLQNVSLGENAFAQAISSWQRQQGFSEKDSDGIIGPKTWAVMRSFIDTLVDSKPVVSTVYNGDAPSIQDIFEFNKWHAQKILATMNNGVLGSNFNSKSQLENIVNGYQVENIDPKNQIIQILPLIYQIAEQARINNYREIMIGSFIRGSKNGKCTGHCAGRSIDINHTGHNFENPSSTQMVINILRYLISLPSMYKKHLGFGMPLQGDFFGRKDLVKFKSVNTSNLINSDLKQFVDQLGIVFPDNDNHLHIQVNWLS